MKRILLSEDTYNMLIQQKSKEHINSTDDFMHGLIVEYRKMKLFEACEKIRKRAKEKGIKLSDVLREAKKVRKEIYEDHFKGH